MSASIETAAATLRANLTNLADRDVAFAGSLLDQLGRRGLSEKQAHWLGVLAERAVPKAAPAAPAGPKFDLTAILTMFAGAGASLKRPALVIASPEAGKIRVSVAGESSREPGTIVVTTAGSFATRAYLGRIRLDGSWVPSGTTMRRDNADSVLALLMRFAADPATVAREFGRETGACSFCSKELTDPTSIVLGYGPVCAKKWGLAHSKEAASAAAPPA